MFAVWTGSLARPLILFLQGERPDPVKKDPVKMQLLSSDNLDLTK